MIGPVFQKGGSTVTKNLKSRGWGLGGGRREERLGHEVIGWRGGDLIGLHYFNEEMWHFLSNLHIHSDSNKAADSEYLASHLSDWDHISQSYEPSC